MDITDLIEEEGEDTVDDRLEEINEKIEEIKSAKDAIGRVVFGQEEIVEQTLITIISGGHGLLVGVPGLAKTLLVETIGTVMGLSVCRVQFTPDLMPNDIIGAEILDVDKEGQKNFRFIEGPLFTQLLMADEINRASPRTQSALLQAMQEYHVSVLGRRHDLPAPFHVLATQNPIEQEGTFSLPEAQLDRFLLQMEMSYPSEETERKILVETTGVVRNKPWAVFSAQKLKRLQHLVRQMPVGETVVEGILELVRGLRPGSMPKPFENTLTWGAGPRAGQALMLACRARALLKGRLAPTLEDVRALAYPAMSHRLSLSFTARAENITVKHIVQEALKSIG